MRRRPIGAIFAWLVVASFGASALYAAEAPGQPPSDVSPVVLGAPLPLSGRLEEFGTMMKNSFEMAKESINEKGGVNGRPIEIVYADDQGKAALGEEVVTRLVIDQKPVMLVGGYASDPTYAMARMAERLDVPFLISTASADKITQRGWKNIYRLNPPISEYTGGLEDFFVKILAPRSMAIVYEDSMFGTAGAMRMMSFCQDNAIDVQALISYQAEKASEEYFRPILAPLTEEPPDVIYMISYLQDAVALVRTIRELKIRSVLVGGAGGFTLEAFIRGAGDAANGVLTVTLWAGDLPYPGAKEYYAEYLKRHGSPPDYHGAEAYSALMVAAEALRRAEAHRPSSIRAALNDLFMITPFGPVKFYSYYDFHRQNSTPTLVQQILEGKFETIWPLEFATKPFVNPLGK